MCNHYVLIKTSFKKYLVSVFRNCNLAGRGRCISTVVRDAGQAMGAGGGTLVGWRHLVALEQG